MIIRSLGGASAALLLAAGSAHAASYTITDIGAFSLDYGATVTDLNNAGQVVGYSYDGLGTSAFLYSGGTMTNLRSTLTPIGGNVANSYAQGINDAGQVVGYSSVADPYVGWSITGGTPTNLGTVGGYPAAPRAVNASGQIVASYITSGLYNPGSGWTAYPPYTWLPTALNDSGLQGGSIYLGYAYHAAVRSAAGVITDIDPLGGNGGVRELNNTGQAAGTRTVVGGEQGFFWDGTTLQNIGWLYTPVGFNAYSGAEGINAAGQVVGYSDTSAANTLFNCTSGARHAVLFQGGSLTDLNGLIDPGAGWCLQYASAINDLGQIAGTGINADGRVHAYLLTPTAVPAPAAGWLLGSAIAGAAGLRRRRGTNV